MLIIKILKLISQLNIQKRVNHLFVNLKRNKKTSFLILNFLIFFSLCCITPFKDKIYTKQFLFEEMDEKQMQSDKINNSFKYKIYENIIEFYLNEDYDFQSLILTGQQEDSHLFVQIMHEISKFKNIPRNIKIRLFNGKICENTSFGFIYLNIKENRNTEKLFFEISRRTTTNSDLFFFLRQFYDISYNFCFKDFFYPFSHFSQINQNSLNLNISKDKLSINKFIKVIRYLMNLESHSLGNYYFLPLKNKREYIFIIQIIPAFLFISINELIFKDSLAFEIDFWSILCIILSFEWPFFLFFLLKNEGIMKIMSFVYVIVFSFNWGLIFIFFMWFFQNLKFIFLEFKQIIN